MQQTSSDRKWSHRFGRYGKLLDSLLTRLIVGVLAVVVLWFLWQRWEIRSLKQVVRALGLPTDREELDQFYVVPAAVLDTSANWGPALSSISKTVRNPAPNELQQLAGDPTRIPLPGEPWDLESQAVAVRNVHRAELKSLHDAASVGGQARLPIDYKLDFEKFESFDNHIRGAFMLLQLEAGVAAYQGDPAKCRAAQKTAAGLYLAIQGQPDLAGFLGANSQLSRLSSTLERLLPYSQWTESELSKLQQQLCSIDYRQQLKLAIAGECVTEVASYEQFYPLTNGSEIEMLQWSLFARQSLDNDWPVVLAQFQSMEAQKTAERKTRFRFSKLSFDVHAPIRNQLAASGAHAAARRSLINAGLAVERFRLRHGRLPSTLAEVDTDLLKRGQDEAIPLTDPFDGKPLKYLVQPERCLIYSIGDDQLDNGGDVDFDETWANHKGPLDMGFSVRR